MCAAPKSNGTPLIEGLPPKRIDRLTAPFVRFLHIESASGVVLALCTVVALLLANSDLVRVYNEVLFTKLHIGIPNLLMFDKDLQFWINDGLMAIFFFVVGLEIKRELVAGELRDPRKVVLPIAAAIGGVVVPVIIYFALQPGGVAERGWAIPMATDIAFVVGCLAILGKRVPYGLKIMLLSLAIVDDILAVIVIAVFYSTDISGMWLLGAVVGIALTVSLNQLGVRSVGVYVFVGAFIWVCTYKGGVHPTVAGALLGLLTPAYAWVKPPTIESMMKTASRYLDRTQAPTPLNDRQRREVLENVVFAARESISPLERLESKLHPWVGFVIMPVFALANAGVVISIAGIADPIGVAVGAGLVLGKPIGIVLAAMLVVMVGMARLPEGVSWTAMAGAGSLAGIGFTMSLFIASLSFDPQIEAKALEAAKTGILFGSLISMIIGMALLLLALPKQSPVADGSTNVPEAHHQLDAQTHPSTDPTAEAPTEAKS